MYYLHIYVLVQFITPHWYEKERITDRSLFHTYWTNRTEVQDRSWAGWMKYIYFQDNRSGARL